MEILPALSEIGRIAADGKYRVLPVSCEILSDFITPIEALRILKNSSAHCYMLESASDLPPLSKRTTKAKPKRR